MLWIQNDKEVNIRQLFHNVLSVEDIPYINTLDFPNTRKTITKIYRIGGIRHGHKCVQFMGNTSFDTSS